MGPVSQKSWWRRLWHVSCRTVRSVVRLEDTPYRIAMGSAAGIFAAYLPVIGQTFVGMALARVFRGNLLASIPWSWISNPVTTLPIWYGCYLLGAAMWPGHQQVRYEDLAALVTAFDEHGWWNTIKRGGGVISDIFLPTLLGSSVIGVVTAIPGYFAVHAMVCRVQAARSAKSRGWQTAPTSPVPMK
jgi:uncharacterized protein (DUF2062 family)